MQEGLKTKASLLSREEDMELFKKKEARSLFKPYPWTLPYQLIP